MRIIALPAYLAFQIPEVVDEPLHLFISPWTVTVLPEQPAVWKCLIRNWQRLVANETIMARTVLAFHREDATDFGKSRQPKVTHPLKYVVNAFIDTFIV